MIRLLNKENDKIIVNDKESNFVQTIQQISENVVDSNGDLVEEIRECSMDNTPLSLSRQSPNTETNENKQVEVISSKTNQEPEKEEKNNNNNKSYQNKYTRGKTATSQNILAISPGILLEYRIKRLIFNLGYYPRMGIDLKTSYDDTADKITDLDVYGIYIHKDFTIKTLWADCKSGYVKIHDRLSWIKGVMSTIQINDVILVAGGVRTSVKQHARKSGIQILDLKIIEKLEEDYGIKSDDWRGSWNPQTQFNKILTLSKISIPTNDKYKKIAKFISSDYWVMDSYSKSKKSLTALRELSSIALIPIPQEHLNVVKWATFELIVMFLLAVLNISKELYYFSDSEKKETVYEGLSSGDIPNKKRSEIFDAAFRVAYSTLKNQIHDFEVPSKMPSINLNPPSYSDAFFDLVLRMTSKPSYFFDILRFMDFTLMEYDLNNRTYNEGDLRIMFNNYDNLLVGSKILLHFICHAANIPRTLFSILS